MKRRIEANRKRNGSGSFAELNNETGFRPGFEKEPGQKSGTQAGPAPVSESVSGSASVSESGSGTASQRPAPLIEADGVYLSYEGAEGAVLEEISFRIEPGTLYCLMGANGCGKSTLINCILGIHPPDRGEIRIDGKEVGSYKPKELAKRIAFVPQVHERTFPYTVEQVVLMGRNAYSGALSGPEKEDMELVRDVLARTGIEHLAERPYTRISGGEMQLVMLARALVQQTAVVIMDEPSAHLDFRNELIFLENAARLIREESTSVLMATHSPNQPFFFEREGINIRILAICDKTLRFEGTPSEVLTEKNISEIYRVQSKLMCGREANVGEIRQIVPLKTF